MNDEFSRTVEKIRRIQAMAPASPEVTEFVKLFVELFGGKIEDSIRYIQEADPVALANAYYTELNQEQARDAIDAVRRGDRSLIEERAEVRLTTPEEKSYLFGKKNMGRPPTLRTRDEWIIATLEALRGAGLTKNAAIVTASKVWGRRLNLSASTIEDIYNGKGYDAAASKKMQEHFIGTSVDEVLEAIEAYCLERTKHNSL